MDKDELVEKVARVIYTERNGKWDYKAWRSDPRIAEAYRKDAVAALKAANLSQLQAELGQLQEQHIGTKHAMQQWIDHHNERADKAEAELDAVRGEMDGLRFAASQALASLNLAIVSGAFPLEKDVAVANAKRLSEALALPVQGEG